MQRDVRDRIARPDRETGSIVGAIGVAIAVSAPPGVAVDHVELLVAPNQCPDGQPGCDRGVSWDTKVPKQDGEIFILNSDELLASKIDSDGVARFRLEPEGTRHQASRVVAIGYQGNKAIAAAELEDVTLPVNHAEIWKVPLVALPDIPQTDPHDIDRLHTWKRNATDLATRVRVRERFVGYELCNVS